MSWVMLNKEYWAGWNWDHIKEVITEDSYLLNALVVLPFYWSLAVFLGMKEVELRIKFALWLPGMVAVVILLSSGAIHKIENRKMEFLCPLAPEERVRNVKRRYTLIVFYRLLFWVLVDLYVGILFRCNVLYMTPAFYHQLAASFIVRGNGVKKMGWNSCGYHMALIMNCIPLLMVAEGDFLLSVVIVFFVVGTVFYIPSLKSTIREFQKITYFEEANQ